MKYLIAGLGNIGEEYSGTRHNIGFTILDALASASNVHFKDTRLAFSAILKYKSRIFVLIKPTTYVNLSGRAVHYWMKKEKVPAVRFDPGALAWSPAAANPFCRNWQLSHAPHGRGPAL